MDSAIRRIDATIKSSSDSILGEGEYRVRGFGSAVESAIRSRPALNSEISSVHGFDCTVENGIKSTTAPDLETRHSVDSFDRTVENAVRSSVAPNPLPLHGFASAVDHAISSNVVAGASAGDAAGAAAGAEGEIETEESRSSTVYRGFTEKKGEGGWGSFVKILAFWFCCRKVSNRARRGKEQLRWRLFSLKELHSATNNFNNDNKLGEGGFGTVYLGQLWDGSQIAVKRLKVSSKRIETEFAAELEILARIRHKNLLSFRGYCAEGQEQLIVYEYMQNLSLHSHLHGHHSLKCPLDWNRRMNIAIGSAEGIAYLHHEATPHIIHRDIKPSNVLLDSDFKARVADFGFGVLIRDSATHLTKKIKGTLGYLAPEYAILGKVNESCDVYSFGVLLLELASGRIPTENLSSTVRPSMVDWALPLVWEKKFSEIADPRLKGNYVEEELKRVVLVALMSAQDLPEKRPTMVDVVELLKGESKDKYSRIENSEMFRKTLAAETNNGT